MIEMWQKGRFAAIQGCHGTWLEHHKDRLFAYSTFNSVGGFLDKDDFGEFGDFINKCSAVPSDMSLTSD